jgi:hypothetical protein
LTCVWLTGIIACFCCFVLLVCVFLRLTVLCILMALALLRLEIVVVSVCLYRDVGVSKTAQDGLRLRRCFAAALLICGCLLVQVSFFATSCTWWVADSCGCGCGAMQAVHSLTHAGRIGGVRCFARAPLSPIKSRTSRVPTYLTETSPSLSKGSGIPPLSFLHRTANRANR